MKEYADFLWLMLLTFLYVNATSILFGFYITNHFFFMCLCFLWYHKKPNSYPQVLFSINMSSKAYLIISNLPLHILCHLHVGDRLESLLASNLVSLRLGICLLLPKSLQHVTLWEGLFQGAEDLCPFG